MAFHIAGRTTIEDAIFIYRSNAYPAIVAKSVTVSTFIQSSINFPPDHSLINGSLLSISMLLLSSYGYLVISGVTINVFGLVRGEILTMVLVVRQFDSSYCNM